jgi:GNAT superfamily N-acetyltransferase
MDVLAAGDPTLVLERAAAFLRRERFTANVVAVELTGTSDGTRPLRPGSTWFLIEDGQEVEGVAMHTPPYPLNLPRLKGAAVAALAEALYDQQHMFPAVSGEATTVDRFLECWRRLAGADARRRAAMRFYVLDRLEPPTGVRGQGRLASEADTQLVAQWVSAFHDEAQPAAPLDDVVGRVRTSIAHGRAWLWEAAHDPVSLAGSPMPAIGVARIGPVYTPPEHRRHGYGTAVTAAATQACLNEGVEHVVLYTDLANPISNSIYQSIGYRPDHDACEWDFV